MMTYATRLTRPLAWLSVLFLLFLAPEAHAQSGDVVVDDDGQAAPGATVDCDASGTANVYASLTDAVNAVNTDNALTSIYICPGTYGPDEDVVIESNLQIQGAGADQVTVQSTPQGSAETAIRIEDGLGLSGIEIKDFRIAQTSASPSNAATLFVGADVDGVEISGLVIERGGSLANTASAIRIDGTNVEVSGCDISGGPIGFFGDPDNNYTIENNTLRGAGNESIWIVDGSEISVVDNTIEATADGDAQDDFTAIAIYNPTASLDFRGNDVREITRTPVVLGAGIPVIDPDTGSPVSVTTTTQLQEIILANNTLGPVTYVSESDATTLRPEAGNASSTASNVFGLRRSITVSADGVGGSSAYGRSAFDLAEQTDGDVIWLADGAMYNENITLPSDLGFASTGTATVDAIDVGDGVVLGTPTGSIQVATGLTVGLNSEIDGTPVVLGDQATLTDGGLTAGRIQATRTVAAGGSSSFGDIGAVLTANGSVSPGEVTVTRTDGEPVTKGVGSISRIYDITAATNTGLDVDLDLEYDDGSDGGDDELATSSVTDASALGVFQTVDDGANWFETSNVTIDVSNNVASTFGLPDLGRFTLAESGGALPVELAQFRASTDGQTAVLTWTTTSETNNTGFHIQQKTDTGYDRIGFVDGAGTTNASTSYRFRVEDLDVGDHTFRLEQVDVDGSTTYSTDRLVTVGLERAYRVSDVAPNPLSERGTIEITVRSPQRVTVDLFDALGRRIRTLSDGEVRANDPKRLVVRPDGLASGHYFVRVRGEAFQATRRVVVVR
ncbi:right-handed parallel beta-helix repeat-containing protein [Longibacter sp.]|uniref:right-handed parallel beta-helix repeat-containing protein n=1 Tax=Longibacter sp. TaxID=2045415 RepID=UPI003EBFD0DB